VAAAANPRDGDDGMVKGKALTWPTREAMGVAAGGWRAAVSPRPLPAWAWVMRFRAVPVGLVPDKHVFAPAPSATTATWKASPGGMRMPLRPREPWRHSLAAPAPHVNLMIPAA